MCPPVVFTIKFELVTAKPKTKAKLCDPGTTVRKKSSKVHPNKAGARMVLVLGRRSSHVAALISFELFY